jgi:uncharacterized protein
MARARAVASAGVATNQVNYLLTAGWRGGCGGAERGSGAGWRAEVGGDDAVPGEAGGPGGAGAAHCDATGMVEEEGLDGSREGRRVGRGHHEAVFRPDALAGTTGVGDDDGASGGGGIEGDEAEAFDAGGGLATRENHEVGGAVGEGEGVGVGDLERAFDVHAELAGPVPEAVEVAGPPHRADKLVDDPRSQVGGQPAEGFDDVELSFARMEATHGEDAPGGGGSVPGPIGQPSEGGNEFLLHRAGDSNEAILRSSRRLGEGFDRARDDPDGIGAAKEAGKARATVRGPRKAQDLRAVKGENEAGGAGKREDPVVEPEADGAGFGQPEHGALTVDLQLPERAEHPPAVGPTLRAAHRSGDDAQPGPRLRGDVARGKDGDVPTGLHRPPHRLGNVGGDASATGRVFMGQDEEGVGNHCPCTRNCGSASWRSFAMASRMSPGKTALITGASRGLGRAFAARLLEEGFAVVGVARQRPAPETLEGVTWLELDLADPAAVECFLEREKDLVGRVDLLLNNAGFSDVGALEDFREEDVRRHLQAMLATPIRLTQAVLPGMRARHEGVIVNVSSLAVELPIPFLGLYNTAKAGLAGFSLSLLIELEGTPVRVIDFRPGDYRTGFHRQSALRSPESGELNTAWAAMREHLAVAPLPERAADDLWRALSAGRRGTVRSGSWFQASLAAWAARNLPAPWMRRRIRRYYGLEGP